MGRDLHIMTGLMQPLPLAVLLAVLLVAAPAAPAPLPAHLHRMALVMPADDGDGAPHVATAAAAAGWRRSLRQGGLPRPLPNFEIGVPAPPKKTFSAWQASAVRERPQELSSVSFVAPGHPGIGYVAICVVARDAHADMLEWINHHVTLGVSKIYLWDHSSEPPMQAVVQGYINAGIVDYHHFAAFEHTSGKPQLFAYDQCLQRHGHRHTWMAFIDVDEFLMFRDPWPSVQSLPHFLRGVEGPDPPPNAYSGLGVHWIIFGSSGHQGRPSGGVLRAYTRCLQLRHGQHTVVKTIVRTACTVSAEGPHSFRHNCSLPVVQTDRSPMRGARSEEPVHKHLALHHYATKSQDEFALKVVRGSAMKRQRGWEFFDFIDEWSTEFNFDGLQLWDSVNTFQHYPAVTQEHLKRYSAEKHEDFWLKGANDPRYQEQLRQKEAAAAAAAATAAAAAAAAKQQQQQAAAAAAAAATAMAAQQQAAAGAALQQAGAQQQAAEQQQAASGAAAAGGQQAVAAVQHEQAAAETQQQVAALQQQVAAAVAQQ